MDINNPDLYSVYNELMEELKANNEDIELAEACCENIMEVGFQIIEECKNFTNFLTKNSES